jgi:hypothetical protein
MDNLNGIVQALRQEHVRLAGELRKVGGALAAFGVTNGHQPARGQLSAAGKARIAAAQRARWAKLRGAPKKAAPVTHKRTMSPAARRKIAAAQRARWAKVKAGKKD